VFNLKHITTLDVHATSHQTNKQTHKLRFSQKRDAVPKFSTAGFRSPDTAETSCCDAFERAVHKQSLVGYCCALQIQPCYGTHDERDETAEDTA
jgi:hypothetical protein